MKQKGWSRERRGSESDVQNKPELRKGKGDGEADSILPVIGTCEKKHEKLRWVG